MFISKLRNYCPECTLKHRLGELCWKGQGTEVVFATKRNHVNTCRAPQIHFVLAGRHLP